MADTLKILAQSSPSAATLTALYTAPASTQVSTSSVVACNTTTATTVFRISVAQGGAVDNIKQYLYYDLSIPGNDTFIATIGLTLNQTDVIRVYSLNGNVVFNLFGSEIV